MSTKRLQRSAILMANAGGVLFSLAVFLLLFSSVSTGSERLVINPDDHTILRDASGNLLRQRDWRLVRNPDGSYARDARGKVIVDDWPRRRREAKDRWFTIFFLGGFFGGPLLILVSFLLFPRNRLFEAPKDGDDPPSLLVLAGH